MSTYIESIQMRKISENTITRLSKDYGVGVKDFTSLLMKLGIIKKNNSSLNKYSLVDESLGKSYQWDIPNHEYSDNIYGYNRSTLKFNVTGVTFIYNKLKELKLLPLIEKINRILEEEKNSILSLYKRSDVFYLGYTKNISPDMDRIPLGDNTAEIIKNLMMNSKKWFEDYYRSNSFKSPRIDYRDSNYEKINNYFNNRKEYLCDTEQDLKTICINKNKNLVKSIINSSFTN